MLYKKYKNAVFSTMSLCVGYLSHLIYYKGIVPISATYTLSYLASLFAKFSVFSFLFTVRRKEIFINKERRYNT